MYPEVSPVVHVYGPPGQDLQDHLKRIEGFNTRAENPTHWEERPYTRPDFLERMISDHGEVVRQDITDDLVTRQMDYKPGDFYSLSKRLASEQSLNRLGIFDLRRIETFVPAPSDTSIWVPSTGGWPGATRSRS